MLLVRFTKPKPPEVTSVDVASAAVLVVVDEAVVASVAVAVAVELVTAVVVTVVDPELSKPLLVVVV